MNPFFRLVSLAARRGLLVLAGPALLSACRHNTEVQPAYDDYFPVVLNTYRTYAVADSTWKSGALTVENYQFRERVAEQFTDAAGKPAYRLLRSKRPSASAAWADDSVLVVQLLPQAVLVTRDNQRSVELIYPPKARKGWNAAAFTVGTGTPDTISNLSRFYTSAVGKPYTTPAVAPQPAKSYDNTVSTFLTPSDGSNQEFNNNLYQQGLRQVYARGVGLVERRRFTLTTFITLPDGSQQVTPGKVQNGFARHEILIDAGTI